MTADLANFLLARIAEAETDARLAQEAADGLAGDGQLWVVTGADNAVGVDYDPARVLAECAAKRAVVEYCRRVVHFAGEPAGMDPDSVPVIEHVLKLFAQPYAAHPDFHPGWRADG